MKAKEWFVDFAKGSALGIGLLPGVSAGTIGITVGIYDKLLDSLNNLKKDFFKSILTLLPIMLGWAIAGIILLYLEHLSWNSIPFIIVLFCAGFTVGGLPVLIKEVRAHKIGWKDWLQMLSGFLVATAIGVLSVLAKINHWFDIESAFLDPNQSIWIYFVTILIGIVAMGACIIPGISGAMILFIFGLYQPVLDLYMGDNSILHNHDRLGTGLILTACLLIGIIIGLLLVAKVMKRLLDRHHDTTYNIVLGFVLGSIVSMFINNQIWDAYFSSSTNVWWQWLIGGAAFLVSCVGTFLLVKRNEKKEVEKKALS